MQLCASSARPAGRLLRSGAFAGLLALTALLALPAAARGDCAEVEPLSLLPADEACPGWTRDGEPLTAHTPEELATIIDGQAFLYVSYGFVAAAFQNYAAEIAGEPVAATVAIFNQGTPENALALYQDPGSGEGTPVADWPGTGGARQQVAFGSVTFQFHEACFFASVVLMPGDESTAPEARCLAEEILGLIQGATPASGATWGEIKRHFEPR
jgi:hypothetical protein